MPEASVIVPAYNAAATIGACLHALLAQTVDRDLYEIIVVDDGSTDETGSVARRYPIRVLQQANAGAAAARNAGADVAQGELLLFTDADCAPAPDWVAQITSPLASDPDVDVTRGAYRTQQRALVARFVQLEYEIRYARLARHPSIDFVDTYSAAYRRRVFEETGGFDPRYRRLEDQEFSFRLAREGYRMVFSPDAIVFHRHARSVAEYWKRKYEIGFWKPLVLRRHPGRAIEDSHTPQALRVQLALAVLGAVAATLGVFYPAAGWAALIAAVAFAGTTVPLLSRIAAADPVVLLVAPLLILVRDVALLVGLAHGLVAGYRVMATADGE